MPGVLARCWSKIFLPVCSFVVHAIRETLELTNMSAHTFHRHIHKLFPIACIAVGMFFSTSLEAGKNKKKSVVSQPEPTSLPEIDTRNLVWPDPPDIARIRWLEQYRGEPKSAEPLAVKAKRKENWMLRVAGVQPVEVSKADMKYRLVRPY